MVYQRTNNEERVFISIRFKENWDWYHKDTDDKEVKNIVSAMNIVRRKIFIRALSC